MPAGTLPTGRIDYAANYFAPLKGILMHGGWGESSKWEPMSETWKLDATGWQLLTVQNAPALAHHSMTCDEARQVLVICGQAVMGQGSHQVWEFNGTVWTRTAELSGSDWWDAEITYDRDRQRLVLYRASMSGQEETWENAGAAWEKKEYAQKPVVCGDGALFKYDAGLKKVVLVGSPGFEAPSETWLWDGTNWAKAGGSQPTNASFGGMTYDGARGQMVLLATDMKTYVLDGSGWTPRSPTHSPTPSPMGFFNLAYDTQRQVSVFFGGEASATGGGAPTYPTATWEWNGAEWTEFEPGVSPPPLVRLSLSKIGVDQVRLSWPTVASNWVLLAQERLDPALDWQPVSATVVVAGEECSTTLGASNPHRFFRLKQP